MAKTPIERAISQTIDRRARYEREQQRKGLARVAVWVPVGLVDRLREIAQKMREGGFE